MTKGRKFVPPPDREGIWFRHRGADNSNGMDRGEVTTTGRMLSAPFVGLSQPRPPPPSFSHRAQTMYHSGNPFSTHDNRNTIQDRGEYFGDPDRQGGRDTRFLGRKLLQPLHTRLHYTGQDFLKHYSRNPVDSDYNTVFATSFKGKACEQPPSARRFPRTRPEPPSGPVPLATSTTEWFPDSPEDVKSTQPSTRVLAISQQPYPKHNTWQYSYKGLPRVYPPYGQPIKVAGVDNVFNRYGAAFASTSSGASAAAADS